MVIKLPIGDFELGIGVFRIMDWGFKSPIPILKTPITDSNKAKAISAELLELNFGQIQWYFGQIQFLF